MAYSKEKKSTETLKIEKRLIPAGEEHPFLIETRKCGKMPTTEPYSDKTKISSPISRGF